MRGGATDREGVEGRTLRVQVAGEGEEGDERDGKACQDGPGLFGKEESGRLDAGVDVVLLVLCKLRPSRAWLSVYS